MSCNCMQGDYYKKTGIYHRPDSKPEKAMEKELKKKGSKKTEEVVIETEALEDKPEDVELR